MGHETGRPLPHRRRPSRPLCFAPLACYIQRENDGFVALCPELDIASQGETVDTARENLREALELFFECASPEEVQQRLGEEVFVTQVEVAVG